jgi:hypothetical protein
MRRLRPSAHALPHCPSAAVSAHLEVQDDLAVAHAVGAAIAVAPGARACTPQNRVPVRLAALVLGLRLQIGTVVLQPLAVVRRVAEHLHGDHHRDPSASQRPTARPPRSLATS